MTLAAPCLPGVTTRTRARGPKEPVATTPKRPRVQAATPSTAIPVPPPNMAFEQWLDDVANVDISLSISLGQSVEHKEETNASENHRSEFSVSLPTMLTRVLQSKLAIDPTRMSTQVQDDDSSKEVFVALTVKGREEPIEEAIAGGLTPRKAFLRSAPHISRVASRLQDCMRQIFGMKDFVVKVE